MVSRVVVPSPSGLASLLAWTALSALWSLDPAQSILEVQRGLSYIVGLAALLLFLRRRSVCALLAGLVAASTLVSGYSLATRPTGGTVAGSGPRSFYADALSGPIGYSGALGLLAAM